MVWWVVGGRLLGAEAVHCGAQAGPTCRTAGQAGAHNWAAQMGVENTRACKAQPFARTHCLFLAACLCHRAWTSSWWRCPTSLGLPARAWRWYCVLYFLAKGEHAAASLAVHCAAGRHCAWSCPWQGCTLMTPLLVGTAPRRDAENSPGSPGGTDTAQPARPTTPSKQQPGSAGSGRTVHLVAASQASAPAWLGPLPAAAGRREPAEAAGPAAATRALAGAAEASRERHTSSELDGPPSLQYLLLPKQAGPSGSEEQV